MSRPSPRAGDVRFPWTDELAELAKRMFLHDGLSAGQIAAAIGAPSRATVSGKLDRIGVKRGAAIAKPGPASRAAFSPAPPRKVAKPVSVDESSEDVVAKGDPNSPTLRRVYVSSAPGCECVLADLPFGRCRWPLDSAGHPPADMRFCGAPQEEGSPYCSTHRKASGARQRSEAQRARDERAVAAMQSARRRRAA